MKFLSSQKKSDAKTTETPGGAPLGRLPGKSETPAETLLEELEEPGVCDVRDRLLDHGATPTYTSDIVRGVQSSGATGAFAIDVAAKCIAQTLSVLPSPKRGRRSTAPHLFVFTGPTGGGKTTTLAKLGRRLEDAGRRVLFATLDAPGASALDRVGGVAHDTDRTELPFVTIRDTTDLAVTLERSSPFDIIVLDTPGLSPRDTQGLNELAAEVDRLGSLGPMDVYLVLPATMGSAALRLARAAFAPLAPAACVLTKLDETDEPGVVLSEVAGARLPVVFLSDGLDTREGLWRPTPDRFADLLLTGKLS